MTGESDQMHQESAVAAIADAYHAIRSDQCGSNLDNGMGLLIMRESVVALLSKAAEGTTYLSLQKCSTNPKAATHVWTKKIARLKDRATITKNFHC